VLRCAGGIRSSYEPSLGLMSQSWAHGGRLSITSQGMGESLPASSSDASDNVFGNTAPHLVEETRMIHIGKAGDIANTTGNALERRIVEGEDEVPIPAEHSRMMAGMDPVHAFQGADPG